MGCYLGRPVRDPSARPHRFQAEPDDPLFEPLVALLGLSVGVETELRSALSRPDVLAAVIYGSWARGTRRANSDIDVLVVGAAPLRELRRVVRPVGKAAGRAIDVTVLSLEELERMRDEQAGYLREIMDAPTIDLIGSLSGLVAQ
jgi:predicted nucleotidyltransferase